MKHIMRLKKIRNKINYKKCLSPNFSDRKNKIIKYVIIHYTGMKSLKSCLNRFKDKASKVSCHWLISNGGAVYKIVDEKKSAWHAGVSSWRNEKMLNESSIGIELDNPGHGANYRNFSNLQMKSLEKLLKVIFLKYNIDKKNILGHSDIAPTRKSDPGELFDWKRLAKKKLAYWPSCKTNINKNIFFSLGDKGVAIFEIKKKLSKIGYNPSKNHDFDLSLKAVVEAFQRRFLPQQINGIINSKLLSKIEDILKNT